MATNNTHLLKLVQAFLDDLGQINELILSHLTDFNQLPIQLIHIIRDFKVEHRKCVNDLVSFLEQNGLTSVHIPESLRIKFTKGTSTELPDPDVGADPSH